MKKNEIILDEIKSWGLSGVILNLISIVALFFIPLAILLYIIGIIFIYIGLRKLSEIVKDFYLKNYYFTFLVLDIIATILFGIIIYFFHSSYPSFQSVSETINSLFWLIFMFAIAWIIGCIGYYYLKKSYELVNVYTGVELFNTVGLLYFIGAILIIVLIGVLLLIVATIVELVAWISLPRSIKIKKSSRKTF